MNTDNTDNRMRQAVDAHLAEKQAQVPWFFIFAYNMFIGFPSFVGWIAGMISGHHLLAFLSLMTGTWLFFGLAKFMGFGVSPFGRVLQVVGTGLALISLMSGALFLHVIEYGAFVLYQIFILACIVGIFAVPFWIRKRNKKFALQREQLQSGAGEQTDQELAEEIKTIPGGAVSEHGPVEYRQRVKRIAESIGYAFTDDGP